MNRPPDDYKTVFATANADASLLSKMGPQLRNCVATNGRGTDTPSGGKDYVKLDKRQALDLYRRLGVEFVDHTQTSIQTEEERNSMRQRIQRMTDMKEVLEKEVQQLREDKRKLEMEIAEQRSASDTKSQLLSEARRSLKALNEKLAENEKERDLLRETHEMSMQENNSLWSSIGHHSEETREQEAQRKGEIERLSKKCDQQRQTIKDQEKAIRQMEEKQESNEKTMEYGMMSAEKLRDSEKKRQRLEKKLENKERERVNLNSKLKEVEKSMAKKGWSDLRKDQKRNRVAGLIEDIDNAARLDLLEDFATLYNGIDALDFTLMTDEQKERARVIFQDMLDNILRNHVDHPLVRILRETGQQQLETWEDVVHCASMGMSKSKRAEWKKVCLELEVFCPFGPTRDFEAMRDIVKIARFLEHYTVKKDDGKTIRVTGVRDVRELLTQSIKAAWTSGKLSLHKDAVRVVNAGDGGGNPSLTKLGFFLPDTENPQSERNYQVYLVYDGSDDAVTLRRVARKWAKQINKIKSVTFEVDGKTVTLRVEWFLSGDIKFLCSAMGHTGSTSTYPCVLCKIHKNDKTILKRRVVPKLTLKRVGVKRKREVTRKVATMVTHEMRTVKGYEKDAENGENSVRYKPLFNVAITRIVPGPFHCVSGAFSELESNAERLALTEHLGDKGVQGVTNLDIELKEVEKKREVQREVVEREECEMEELQEAFLLFSQSASHVLKRDVCVREQCSAQCIAFGKEKAKFSAERLRKVKCAQCEEKGDKSKKHYVCEALFSEEDVEKAERDEGTAGGYVCKRCEHSSDEEIMRIVKEKIDLQAAVVIPRERAALAKLEERENTLREVKLDTGGPVYHKLLDAIRRAGADARAWFQKFTGNHIRKVLKGDGPAIICGVFDRSKTPQAADLENAFVLLGKMQGASTADDLSDERMEQFRRDKNAFFDALARLDRECTMRPKLHYLDSHVYPFMRLHGSWGRFAEQGVESKHANWNKKARTHCAVVKQPFLQRERIMNDMYVEHMYHLNPVRDMTEELDAYKKAKREGKTWSEIVGGQDERAAKELPEEDEDNMDEWETVEDEPPVEYDTEVAYEDESE